MKCILYGKTYNTETSTMVAIASLEDNADLSCEEHLYQTRDGNFFIHYNDFYSTDLVAGNKLAVDEDEGEAIWGGIESWEIEEWCQQHHIQVFDPDLFPGETDEPGTIRPFPGTDMEGTIYLRVPGSLKRRIEKVAKAEGQSVNAWTMRCVENCLEEKRPKPA